jgi:hypothetical protein
MCRGSEGAGSLRKKLLEQKEKEATCSPEVQLRVRAAVPRTRARVRALGA